MGYRLVELGDDILNGPVTIGQLFPVVFHCRGKMIIILKKFFKAGVNVFLGKASWKRSVWFMTLSRSLKGAVLINSSTPWKVLMLICMRLFK